MNRIHQKWQYLQGHSRKALIGFITAGDPDLAQSKDLVLSLERGGCDIVELGVPFSDPMADGPVIQKASERSLAQGTTLIKVLELVSEIRKKSQVPLLLMGYYNPILAYGIEAFSKKAKEAGVDAVLVVDLPPEESDALNQELKKNDIDLIYLLTPTSHQDRIHEVVKRARGFIYFVSITGVTGGAIVAQDEIKKKIHAIRQKTKLPIAIGFGIRNKEQVHSLASLADGVVVGSALVSLVESTPVANLCSTIESFTRELHRGLE